MQFLSTATSAGIVWLTSLSVTARCHGANAPATRNTSDWISSYVFLPFGLSQRFLCANWRGAWTLSSIQKHLQQGWEGAGGGWARRAVAFSIFKVETWLQPEVFNYLHGTEREKKCVKLHFLLGNKIDMNSIFKIGEPI